MANPSMAGVHMTDIRDLVLQPLTADAFAPYGTVVAATEDGAPFGSGDAQLDLAGGTPRFYIMRLDFRERIIRRITRHLNVTQVLASVGGKPWQLAVAPPGEAVEPHIEDIRAFSIPGNVAVMLRKGTWHAGPYFDAAETSFFNLELSDTNVTDHHTCKIEERFSTALRLIGDA